MTGYRKTRILAAVVLSTLSIFAPGAEFLEYNIRTTGDPWTKTDRDNPIPFFYGYASSSAGPGADAFQKCLDLSKRSGLPLAFYWGCDNCSICSTFANELNELSNSASIQMGHMQCVLGYFRGKDAGTGPAACAEARRFFDTHLGGAKGQCHLLGFYAEYPDGTVMTRSILAPAKMSNYFGRIYEWKLEYDKELPKHLYKPPASDSKFVVGTNANDRLEAMPGTESVWVPMTRTNNLSVACNEKIVAKYPDGTSEKRKMYCAISVGGGQDLDFWGKNNKNVPKRTTFCDNGALPQKNHQQKGCAI